MRTLGILILLVCSFAATGCRGGGYDRWSGSAAQQQRSLVNEAPSAGEIYPNRD